MGAIIGNIDVAQVVLYVFWLFFAGLIFYLRREDRREGYPKESELSGRLIDESSIGIPEPKTFTLQHGGSMQAPNGRRDTRQLKAEPAAGFTGAPIVPTGDPMVDGVGPAAYAERRGEPELTFHGHNKLVPLRLATDFVVEKRDSDPRGLPVYGADDKVAGSVADIWVDREESLIRYLEVALPETEGGRHVLLPMTMARVPSFTTKPRVAVASITARHFALVPAQANPDQVTLLEEDKICAFYASGHLFATPDRQEPLL